MAVLDFGFSFVKFQVFSKSVFANPNPSLLELQIRNK